MENDDKNADSKEKASEPGRREERPPSIFTPPEIRDIVKGFVSAWIRKSVKIDFPLATEILQRAKWEGRKMEQAEATQREVSGKSDFVNLIMICAGNQPATDAQLDRAVTELFKELLIFRAGDRVEGVFWESSLEDRLCRLERGLEVTSNLVRELVELHRGELQS